MLLTVKENTQCSQCTNVIHNLHYGVKNDKNMVSVDEIDPL